MAEYKLSRAAKEDLIRIHHYGVRQFGVHQADKYLNRFFESFDLIAANPTLFESVDHIRPGYRRCVCGVDNIFFRVEDGTAEVIAILGRQETDLILP
ncbi:MAG: type II toxin-antitoxin system RelE/ParE family toxin [Saprospiraceae bacterium]